MATLHRFHTPQLLPQEVARSLELAIIFCDLAPGMRLLELDVARRYGISRSPVREAFRLLEQSGLVRRLARRGVIVAPYGRADLDEVYACRVVLEGLAAEEAARGRRDGDIALLRGNLAALEETHRSGDTRAFLQQNVALSTCMYQAAHNQTLARLLDGIGKQALRYRYLAYSKVPDLIRLSVEGNAQVVDAIVEGYEQEARGVLQHMVRRSWRMVRPHIPAGDSDPLEGQGVA